MTSAHAIALLTIVSICAGEKFKVLSDESLPSCNAEQKDGMIIVPDCADRILVVSTFGQRTISCSEARGLRFIGPVYIRTASCDQVLNTLDFCPVIPRDAGPVSRPCRDGLHWGTKLFLVAIVLLILLQIVVFRLIQLFFFYRKAGYRLVTVTRMKNGFDFKMGKKRTPSGGRVLEGGEVFEPMAREDKLKVFHMSKLQVALFCLLVFSPKLSDAMHHEVFIHGNANITVSGFRIYTDDIHVDIPLTHVHNTATIHGKKLDYELKVWKQESCPTCLSFTKNGRKVWDLYGVQDGVGDIVLEFCEPHGDGDLMDFFHDACTLRRFDISWTVSKEWKVFTMSPGILFSKIVPSTSRCYITSVETLLPLVLTGMALQSPSGEYYYCPDEYYNSEPLMGSVNSFQIGPDGQFYLAKDYADCQYHKARDFQCEIRRHRMEDLVMGCTKLPGFVQGMNVSSNGNSLQVRRDPSSKVAVDCSTEEDSNPSCGRLQQFSSGHIEGPHGVLMRFVTEITADAVWEGVIPCLGEMFTIPCDKEGIAVVVPGGSPCMNATPLENRHVLGPEHLADPKWDSAGFSDQHTDSSSIWANINTFFGSTLLHMVLGSPLLLLCALMVLKFLFK